MMGGRRVQTPDGAAWLIRRRWVKWRPRWVPLWPRKRRDRDDEAVWWPLWLLELEELGVVLLLVVAVFVLFLLFLLPALIFVLQLLLFIALLILGLGMRMVFRRPWIVEAIRADGKERREWAVVGWWRSRQVIAEVAHGISLGHRHIEPEGAQLVRSAEPAKPN